MEQTYEWIRLAQAGDAAAKDNLLQENSGLIWSVVGRFRGRGEPEDLYQIGAIGLLKCIEKFDFSYDVKFSTYAVPMILGEIKRFLRDDGTVKVSRSLKELAWRAKRLQEAAMQEESRELSLQELAERLEVEKEELVLALESTKDVESLYASVDGNEGTLQLIDKLADNTESEKMMERLSLMEALDKSLFCDIFRIARRRMLRGTSAFLRYRFRALKNGYFPNSESIYRKRTRKKREHKIESIKNRKQWFVFL